MNLWENSKASTRVVNAEIFKQVYDSPHSLPGKEKWITTFSNYPRLLKDGTEFQICGNLIANNTNKQ